MIDWVVGGLPVHVLIVHLTVVIIPLAALCALLAAFWPAARRRLGMVTPLLALVALLVVPVTILAGQWLHARVAHTPAIEHHAALGPLMLWWVIGLFIATVGQYIWHRTSARLNGGPRIVGGLLITFVVVVAAVGSVVMVAIVGEAGAAAVWTGNF